MHTGIISVIIPVYKVEPYIHQCIDSVLNQTYTNLEIILVDDGSPDNCGAICDEYARKDSRVTVIHKENGGLSSARNAGLEIASGEYIAFVDSDDWIDADMYQKLYNLAVEFSADIVEGSYRFYRPWKTHNQTLESPNTKAISTYNNVEALNHFYFGPELFSDVAVMVWNKIYKAELIKNFRFYEGIIYEDSEFTPRILYSCNKYIKYEQSFYTYNIHLGASQISHNNKNIFKIRSSIISAESVKDFFATNYLENVSEYTEQRYWHNLLEGYYNCWLLRDQNECRIYAKQIEENLKKDKLKIYKSDAISNKWHYKIYFFSHTIFCIMKYILRYMKDLKYKVCVKLTGRN